MKNSGQFDRDIAAADQGDFLWSLAHLEKTVGSHAVFGARYVGNNRITASRDDDSCCRILFAVNIDSRRIDKTCAALDVANAAFLEIAFIDTIQAGNIGVAFFLDLRPFVPLDRNIETVIFRMFKHQCMVRRIPHELLGHATDVDTGAAERAGFDDRCFRAIFRRTLRMRQATTAAADDYEIKTRCHFSSLRIACHAMAIPDV